MRRKGRKRGRKNGEEGREDAPDPNQVASATKK
jgi:hypothetical protein